jgi:spore coat polysaccharide biosynthesis protein SpsF
MNRVVIVQARMTSTRLPGKVLMEVAGKPMLSQQIRRLRQCRMVDDIVVATTANSTDDPVVDLARQEEVRWFRGSEHDVLSRYVGAAQESGADVLIRVTADCPLLDPDVTDKVIHELVRHVAVCDYASNVLVRTYPRGLDVEALFLDTLLRIDRLGQSDAAREHVTVVPRSERPDLFLLRSIVDGDDNSDLRWTVDTPADLELIRQLYSELDLGGRSMSYREVLAYVRARPDLMALNEGIETWTPAR